MSNADIILSNTGTVALNSLTEVSTLARIAVASKICGVTSVEDAVIRILSGAELGLTPMQSLRAYYVQNGRPTMYADAMIAVCRKHKLCKYFRLVESTDTVATYETWRDGEPEPTRLSYTLQQAKAAELTGRGPWKAHPADMLRARCASKLARIVYQDLLSGVYTPDEADDFPKAKRLTQQDTRPEVVEAVVVEPTGEEEERVFRKWAEKFAQCASNDEIDAVRSEAREAGLSEAVRERLADVVASIRSSLAALWVMPRKQNE